MLKSSIISLVVLWQTNILWALNTDVCTKHLHTLASNQKDFVQCSTLHSVPVNLCIGCYDPFQKMKEAYETLRKEPNCTETYFDKDRINIVSTTQSILTGLWTKAFCEDCFSGNNSLTFDEKLTAVKECFEKNAKNVCVACMNEYVDLNTFYKQVLDVHNNGQVCYDLQDSMNRTRSTWSKTFKCCHHDFNMLFFLLASGTVALLPLVFYGSVYFLTIRREQNHGILNEDPEFDSSTSEQATTSNGISSAATLAPTQLPPHIRTPLPSSSPPPLEVHKQMRAKASNFADDSDETDSDDAEPPLRKKLHQK